MTWWLWILLGLVLLGLELSTPGGFFIAFFGAGALVVGVLTGLGLVGPVWMQWLLYSILSIVFLVFFRRPLLEWMKRREPKRPAVDAIEGQTAILTEDLPAGGVGRAELRGTSWSVRSRESRALPSGQRCLVERVDGLMLWVRAE
jgi:membrane protein implicated in regulation of membrane protease activity